MKLNIIYFIFLYIYSLSLLYSRTVYKHWPNPVLRIQYHTECRRLSLVWKNGGCRLEHRQLDSKITWRYVDNNKLIYYRCIIVIIILFFIHLLFNNCTLIMGTANLYNGKSDTFKHYIYIYIYVLLKLFR